MNAETNAQRNTRQRSAVSAVLNDVEGFNSAQELHALLRERGERVGLTTVYRTLQGLADAGEVDVMRPPGGEHLYRRCSQGHHHHLVCRACGRAVEVEGFHSAQQLHAMLRDRGERVGLTTVYRTLQALADAGDIDVMRPPNGEQLFRRCSDGHHHHLVCRSCGRTVEVAGPAVESWADRVAAQHGFVDVSHTLEIFGTCQGCANS